MGIVDKASCQKFPCVLFVPLLKLKGGQFNVERRGEGIFPIYGAGLYPVIQPPVFISFLLGRDFSPFLQCCVNFLV